MPEALRDCVFLLLTLDGIRSSLKESRSKPMPERQDFLPDGDRETALRTD